jgi:mycothiol synthase
MAGTRSNTGAWPKAARVIANGFGVTAARMMQLLTVADADPVCWDLAALTGEVDRCDTGAPAEVGGQAPAGDPRRTGHGKAGVQQRVVVAVEEATGLVVALTEVPLHPNDSAHTLWQDTVVAPAHRGHGLARFIKAHMLRWLLADRPALERIDTGTAAANAPMIRVNEQLGFVTTREVLVVSRSF